MNTQSNQVLDMSLLDGAIYKSVFHNNPAPLAVTAADGSFLFVNDAFCDFIGYSAKELKELKLSQITILDELGKISMLQLNELRKRNRDGITVEKHYRKKNGDVAHSMTVVRPVYKDNELIEGVTVAAIFDIGDQQVGQVKHLYHLINFDALTDLGNRFYLLNHLDSLILAGISFWLLHLDIKGFTEVNDAYGHAVGDQVLVELTRRMQDVAPKGSVLTRLSGDEFALLLPHAKRGVANKLAHVFAANISMPLRLGFDEIQVGVNIGLAAYPEHGETTEDLLRNADIARINAKKIKQETVVFNPDLAKDLVRKVELKRTITQAINDCELEVYYQPILDLKTGKVNKLETLVRWSSKEYGAISAGEIIEHAESSGLIHALGRCVINEALKQQVEWRSQGIEVQVAVNVSAHELYSVGFFTNLRACLDRYKLPASVLAIEVTETSAVQEKSNQTQVLERLNELGISIAIDDFGKGYSSIRYLQGGTSEIVKIDLSFVQDIKTLEDTRSNPGEMLRAIIDLAKRFKHKVVAEGVETQLQYDFLKSLDCDYLQGYFIGRPAAAAELGQFLDT